MAFPLGFGKAGSNPFQLFDAGMSGISGLMNPTYDPGQSLLQQGLVASLASGKPATEVPYEPHGLIPLALSKLGLTPANIQVPASDQAYEKLALEQQRRQKMSDLMNNSALFMSMMGKIGSESMGKFFGSLSPEEQAMFPGITPEVISQAQTPEMTKADFDQWKKTQGEESLDIRSRLADIQQQRANDALSIANLRATSHVGDSIDKFLQGENDRYYSQHISDINRQLLEGGNIRDPALVRQRDFLQKAMANHVPYNEALMGLQQLESIAPKASAPSGPGFMSSLMHLLASPFTSSGPAQAQAPTTVPRTVKPW